MSCVPFAGAKSQSSSAEAGPKEVPTWQPECGVLGAANGFFSKIHTKVSQYLFHAAIKAVICDFTT